MGQMMTAIAGQAGVLALFMEPVDVPTEPASLLLLLPLCLSIALVYKAIKLEPFRLGRYAWEVVLLFATMVGFLALVAGVLLLVSEWVRR